jgi:hypothetical protein
VESGDLSDVSDFESDDISNDEENDVENDVSGRMKQNHLSKLRSLKYASRSIIIWLAVSV